MLFVSSKIFVKISILFLFLVSCFIFCGSPSTRSQLKEDGVDYITEGWLDDNTFQVRAIGAPNVSAKGFVKRRTQAEEAALLSAQKRVIEILVGADIKGSSASQDGELDTVALKKQFQSFIKGGLIVKKTFDTSDNCEVTYRIHADALKEKAETIINKN